MKLTKKLLSLLLCALLTFTVLPVSLASPAESADLLLATMSDVHYYPASLAQYKGEAFYDYLRGHNDVYENLDGLLDSAFAAIKRDVEEKGLKYLVLTGDLTTNGEYEGHVALAEKLRALEEETGVHVYVTNGNHDINNSDASEFTDPDLARHPARPTTAAEFYEIYKDLGFSEAVSTFSAFDTGKAGALSYAVKVPGYRFIFIDAGKYSADHTDKKRNEHETGGDVTPEVFEWVRAQAEEAKKDGDVPLAFTHWNLSEMNYLHGSVLQGFVIDDGYRLQEAFADMGIHYVFSGHQHVTDLDVTYSDAGEPLYSIITPTLTQYPFAFRETAFSAKDGKVTADFERVDADAAKPVVSLSGEVQPQPYREEGFRLQFGNNDPATYLTWMARGILSPWIAEIQKTGSIVTFVRDRFGLDLRAKLTELIGGVPILGDNEIFNADNVLALVADIDAQLVEQYIYHPDRLWTALSAVIEKLVSLEVSSYPCDRWLGSYGFGDATRPGNVGDLFFAALVNMYDGNEDNAGDRFVESALEYCSSRPFVDALLDRALDAVVQDLLVDELLSNLQVNVDALFNGKSPTVAQALAMFYRVVAASSASGIFNSGSFSEFISNFGSIITSLMNRTSATSYARLLERVLSTGWIKQGTNAKELANTILNDYIGDEEREAAAWQIGLILDTVFSDEDVDYGENYDYTGPVEVVPTKEDMQLPTDLTLRLDGPDAVTVRWLTKYSVTGSDLRLFDASGRAVAAETEASSETVPYKTFGFSFGSFGILENEMDVVAHEVKLRGLTPGATYTYQVGDASKNFWGEKGTFTLAAEDAAPALIFVSDVAAPTPEGYERWAKNLKAAADGIDGAKAIVLGGKTVLNAKDDSQFSFSLNAASETLANVPVFVVWGETDVDETGRAALHFGDLSDDPFADNLQGPAYVRDLGALCVGVISSGDLGADGAFSGAQIRTLQRGFEKSKATWRVLALHGDLFGEGSDALRKQVGDLADACEVDLVLAGNESYARSYYRAQGGFMPTAKVKEVTVAGETYPTFEPEGGSVWVSSGSAAGRGSVAEAAKELLYVSEKKADDAVTVVRFERSVATVKTTIAGVKEDAFALQKTERRMKLGDIDRDGSITAADARLALRAAVDLETFSPALTKIADVDADNKVTAADARLILRAAVDLETIRPEYIHVYADMN